MDFPILDLMDQDGCYHKLLDLLHPDGLVCPRFAARDGLNVHRHRPESAVVDYRCQGCCRVFNLFTGTPWQGTHLSPSQILLIVRGIAQGVPTAKLAREVEVSRQHCCGCGTRSRPAPWPPRTARRCQTIRPRPTRCTRTRGKKGCHTPTRTTRHGDGRTRRKATAPGRPTGRRCPQRWVDRAVGCGSASGSKAGRRSWSTPRSCRLPSRGRWCTPTSGTGTSRWRVVAAATRQSTITRGSTRGTTTVTGYGGALQHHGGDLDGAAELPPAVSGRQQRIFRTIRHHVPMVVQSQGGHRRVPAVLAQMFSNHQIRYMSQS